MPRLPYFPPQCVMRSHRCSEYQHLLRRMQIHSETRNQWATNVLSLRASATMPPPIDLDVLILGGGIQGLRLLRASLSNQ